MQSNNFKNDVASGTKGEIIVMAWLLKQKGIKNVIDVSDDEFFQKKDVDLIVQLSNNKVCKVEIKTDFKAHETGNIPFEYESNADLHFDGCLKKTQADRIFFYIYNTHDLLIANCENLKKYIEDNKEKLVFTKMGDTSKGYLLNINNLLNEKIIKKIERII